MVATLSEMDKTLEPVPNVFVGENTNDWELPANSKYPV